MQTMEYRCSAHAWEFSHMFSSVSGNDRGEKKNPFLGCLFTIGIWIILAGSYYFLVWVAPQLEGKISWLKDYAILIGFIIGGWYFIASLRKLNKAYVRPEPKQYINYIKLEEQGISLNVYNNEAIEALPFIYWSNIKHIKLDITKELRFYIGGKNYPIRHQEQIDSYNARYPQYTPEQALSIYQDRFTLVIEKEGSALSHAVIQLPKEWINNGVLMHLLKQLQLYSGKVIQPYDEKAKVYVQPWLSQL